MGIIFDHIIVHEFSTTSFLRCEKPTVIQLSSRKFCYNKALISSVLLKLFKSSIKEKTPLQQSEVLMPEASLLTGLVSETLRYFEQLLQGIVKTPPVGWYIRTPFFVM